MPNLYQQFRGLLPRAPLLVGTVAAVTGSEARITTPDGAIYTARGVATVGDTVYFRPGAGIEGEAPALTAVVIELPAVP